MLGSDLALNFVITLSGAALVSLLVVALINAESKNKLSQEQDDSSNLSLWRIFTNSNSKGKTPVKQEDGIKEQSGTSRKLHWAEEGKHHLRHGRHRGGRRGTTTQNIIESCYSSNEVLAIIGITCLLNFAFVLLVMACVHYCSSKSEIPRLESILIESESDDSIRDWDRRSSSVSLHTIPLYRNKTPSQSMEQLLFVD